MSLVVTFVIYFVIYFAIHIGIGLLDKKLKDDVKFAPERQELKEQSKWASRSFKWFPFAYVIFVLIITAI